MCLALSPLVSLIYRAKCINLRVNNSPKCFQPNLDTCASPYPPRSVSCIERSVSIPEWTTPQSVWHPNLKTCAWPSAPFGIGTFRHLSTPFRTFRHRHFSAPFGTFRIHIRIRFRVFAFVYVHVRHLGTSFRTSLYPVLSKNIALHKVYWRFIIHCICVYHVIVYLRLCICMSDSWQHPLGARFYWGRLLIIGGTIINNWGQGFIGGDH